MQQTAAGQVAAATVGTEVAGAKAKLQGALLDNTGKLLEEVKASGNVLWVKLLDNVAGKLVSIRRGSYGWVSRNIPCGVFVTGASCM